MPAIEKKARQNGDPLQGLTDIVEAAISLGAREHSILAAARKADALDNVSARLDEALYELMRRAQEAGVVRADLVADDLPPRIIAMLNSVLWTMDPTSDGWRRYVTLMLDAITTTAPRPLQSAVPLRLPSHTGGSWPL